MKHPCDLCGETQTLPVPGDPSGKIGICTSCGFVYVAERRGVAEIAAAWSEIYANGTYDPEWSGVQARLFYVAVWINQNIGLRGKSVLDIGAGNGLFLEFCKQAGAEPTGLDPDEGNCAKVRSRSIPCLNGWAADGRNLSNKYDLICLNWCLENTADCLAVLRYAKRCLAPGGHVVVATGSRICVPWKKPLSSYLPQDKDYPHDTHCYRWSSRSLYRAAVMCGLLLQRENDFHERDEMVNIFVDGKGPIPGVCDPPDMIADYFSDWQKNFP